MAYAKDTEVSVEKSRAEIETILKRYGASHFAYMTEPARAVIAFRAKDRNIRFDLPLPSTDDKQFTHYRHSSGNLLPRTQGAAQAQWEQGCRQKWRALTLCIKAKLESVESKIETFEEAFLAHVVMPDGRTVAEHTTPRIAQSYAGGEVTALLPPPKGM